MDAQERASKLQAILANLESVNSIAFEFELAQKVFKLSTEDESFRDDLPWRAEVMAFQFRESSHFGQEEADLYYLPFSSFTTKDGVVHDNPDASTITREIVDYWLKRATESNNPILKARYSGLAWEFGKKQLHMRVGHSVAEIHVTALLEIAEHDLCTEPVGTINKLLRAFNISCGLNNKTLIEKSKSALITYEKKVGEDHHAGLWGYSFEVLMQNKNAHLSQSEKDQLIADMEGRLKRLTDSTNGKIPDHWSAEHAASILADYYRRTNDPDNLKRVITLLGNAWNAAASKADALLASAWLEQLHAIYENYGLKIEATDTLNRIRALAPDVLKSMKPIEHRVEIPKDEYEAFMSRMVQGGLEKALPRITRRFIPKQSTVKGILQNMETSAPLSSMLRKQLMDQDGTVTATVGSSTEDVAGNVAHQTAQLIQFESQFLSEVISHLRETYNVDTNAIVDWLFQSPAFKDDRRALIENGMEAYFKNDHLAALYILIPQIEAIVRNLLELCGGSISKKNRMGGYDLRTLDDLLRDPKIITSLGEDTTIYLRILLTDLRGWNLRNDLCHGKLPFEAANRAITDRILHALLCFSMIRKVEHTINVVIKSPDQCTSDELNRFADLVREGGEVDEAGLNTRIENAVALTFVHRNDELIGIAAVKRPNVRYRNDVFAKAGVNSSAEHFQYELGWIYVADRARGTGQSRTLVEASLKAVSDVSLFATTWAENERMKKSLERFGFKMIGKPFSGRKDRKLVLYIREMKK